MNPAPTQAKQLTDRCVESMATSIDALDVIKADDTWIQSLVSLILHLRNTNNINRTSFGRPLHGLPYHELSHLVAQPIRGGLLWR